jgi:cytidylate kinase
MSVITISRQMGTLGCQIAFTVADTLGYKLVWRELINEAARRTGTPEVALAAIDELGLLGICPTLKACRAYHQAVKEIMLELADQGNVVLLGRAGQVIIGKRPDTLHVRLVAPIAERITRIAQRMGTSEECARAQISASDRYRSTYLRRFYHINWDDPTLYHLIINTASFQIQQVVELICQTFKKTCIDSSLATATN